MDFEDIWEFREEQVYPSLFGSGSRGIFPLTRELFADRFKQSTIDMMWQFFGVFEFPPNERRNSWLYVTSGPSNAWPDDEGNYKTDGPSGYGVEFFLSVSEQGDWAIQTLQNMLAFFLLLDAGMIADAPPLALHDRVPLHGPINGDADCQIRHVLLAEPEDVPSEFKLPSGGVQLLGFVGITDAEKHFAKFNGSPALIPLLRSAGVFRVTDPHRRSIALPSA